MAQSTKFRILPVYRLLKAHDLITSPAFVVVKAADEFHDKTTAPNQLWQTDFTYLKVIGWGWFYLSTILDDFSRYIIAWKLCTPADAYFGRDTAIIERRQKTHHPKPPLESSTAGGLTANQDELNPPLENTLICPKCFDDGHFEVTSPKVISSMKLHRHVVFSQKTVWFMVISEI